MSEFASEHLFIDYVGRLWLFRDEVHSIGPLFCGYMGRDPRWPGGSILGEEEPIWWTYELGYLTDLWEDWIRDSREYASQLRQDYFGDRL